MMLEVIEEIADTGGIEVVELQLGWFRAMPRGGEDQHQPQGIPIGRERMRAGDAVTEMLDSLLAADEAKALRRRLDRLIERGKHPEPGRGYNVPWPPV